MNLRIKVILAILLVTVTSLGLLYLALSHTVVGGFQQLERACSIQSVERTMQALAQIESQLDSSLWAYSSWNASYDFVRDRNVAKAWNAGYDNLMASSTSIELCLLFDDKNVLIYQNARREEFGPLLGDAAGYFQKHPDLLQHHGLETPHLGLAVLPEGIFIFSSRSVLRSDNSGPSHGALVFGQMLRDEDFMRMGEMASIDFRLLTLDRVTLPGREPDFRSNLLGGARIYLDSEKEGPDKDRPQYRALCFLKDLAGNESVVISADLPRAIYQYAEKSLLIVLWALALSGGILCLAVVILLERLILRRLMNLSREVLAIGSARKSEARVSDEKNDEIGSLGRGINTMLAELQSAHHELISATQNAEKADRAKSEFVANMSHEIRTPLNSIMGFTELLKKQVVGIKPQEYLQSIIAASRTLMGLINDILDLSKIEAGGVELKPGPVSLRDVALEVRQIFILRAEEKGLNLKVEISPRTPWRLFLDEIRLRQVLFNLLGNAIKFTDYGSVTVKIDAEPMPGEEDHFNLTIDVIDTGPGIPAEQQAVIFEAFRQKEGQSTRKFGGTGLGLTITKRLVTMMPGTIKIISRVGQGSLFRVYLPAVPRVIEQTAQVTPAQLNPGSVEFSPAHVLIVDDDQINRKLAKSLLDETPLKITEAVNGSEALALAKRNPPDLVIADLRMPIMDGLELSWAFKQDTRLRNIPIIIATASVLKNEEAEIRKSCQGYLRKPFTQAELIQGISQFLPYQTRAIIPQEAPSPPDSAWNDLPEEPASNKAALAQLHHYLQESALAQWRALGPNFVVDEAENFARNLMERANAGGSRSVRAYAERLLTAVQNFDLTESRDLLAQFPGVVQRCLHHLTQPLPTPIAPS